ncbi:MAG: hypothetical protein R3301_19175, partial [Saprospiraceae bacterium]|nr:hypothetical protein [Saprospiraceae bacterium]
MKCSLTVTIILLSVSGIFGQGSVGIGTTTPDASAILEVQSTTQGLLIPRLTTAQRGAIAAPATGLMVYDADLKIIMYYDGTAWVSSSLLVPSLIADADGDTRVQTEEMPDEDVIRFDVSGSEFATMDGKTLRIGTPDSSLFIGIDAGINDDGTNNRNTFLGTLS